MQIAVEHDDGSGGPFEWILGVNDPLGVFAWSHEPARSGRIDQWRISTARNHTPGGSYSWKCGPAGSQAYANLLDAALVTKTYPLAGAEALRFWHWIDAEDGSNGQAWDGGLVETSIDGGPWTRIAPDGGYPYEMIPGSSAPFPGGTPVFSGTFDWAEERFDLTGLSGSTIRFRFRFGSDGGVGGQGWYLDDIVLDGATPSGLETDPLASGSAGDRLQFAAPAPNPARDQVRLAFVQPAGVDAQLLVVDAGGRRVAEWSWSAPETDAPRDIAWDGRWNGSRLPTGVYFARLAAGSAQRSHRLVFVD